MSSHESAALRQTPVGIAVDVRSTLPTTAMSSSEHSSTGNNNAVGSPHRPNPAAVYQSMRAKEDQQEECPWVPQSVKPHILSTEVAPAEPTLADLYAAMSSLESSQEIIRDRLDLLLDNVVGGSFERPYSLHRWRTDSVFRPSQSQSVNGVHQQAPAAPLSHEMSSISSRVDPSVSAATSGQPAGALMSRQTSGSTDEEGEMQKGLPSLKHTSHRKLTHRVQARLGLRGRHEEVTVNCLHTALVTLGIEQFDLLDMQELLLEMRNVFQSGAMSKGHSGMRGRLRRQNRMELECRSIPFNHFVRVLLQRDSHLGLLSAKGTNMLRVVREVLLCGDANRLVAQLAQVRIDDLAAPTPPVSWATRLEPVVGLVIILNGVLIGVETDLGVEKTLTGPWFWMDTFFTLFFLLEMVLKTWQYGLKALLWVRDDWAWNVFDAIIVVLALADTTVTITKSRQGEQLDTGTFTIMRIMRLTRLTRLFRIFQLRQMRELALMVKGLFAGMRTLGWAVILLFFTIYVIAILMAALLKLEEPGIVVKEEQLFETVWMSMFTLFRCFIGDCQDSQGRSVAKLMADHYGWSFVVGYLIATFLVTFGVFNLIFAIYIENTLSLAKVSKSGHLERYQESLRIAHVAKKLLKKFCTAYKANEEMQNWHKEESVKTVLRQTTNTELEDVHMKVSKELFLLVIQDPEVQKLMNELDIPPDRASLFDTLDADGSGGLEAAELIQGLLRVRGEARKSDVIASVLAIRAAQDLIRQVRTGQEQLHETTKQILHLFPSAAAPPPHPPHVLRHPYYSNPPSPTPHHGAHDREKEEKDSAMPTHHEEQQQRQEQLAELHTVSQAARNNQLLRSASSCCETVPKSQAMRRL